MGMFDFILDFGRITFIVSFIFFIGHILFEFSSIDKNKESSSSAFFFKLVIGLLFMTTVFAVFKTSGNTVLSGILLLGIALYFSQKGKITVNRNQLLLNKEEIYLLKIAPIIIMVFKILIHFLVFKTKESLDLDFVYYGALSDYLREYGFESNSLAINNMGIAPNLYHYFNEWCVAFITSIFDVTGTYALIHIFFPLVSSFLFFGLYALSKKIINWKRPVMISIPFLFFILPLLTRSNNVPVLFVVQGFEVSVISFFLGTTSLKLIIVSMLIISIFLYYKKEDILTTTLISSMIPLVWPSTAISIFSGLGFFLIYKSYKARKVFFLPLIILCATALYLVLFYVLNSKLLAFSYYDNSSYLAGLVAHINDISLLPHLKYLIGTAGVRIYYYLFFFIAVLFVFRKLKNEVLADRRIKELLFLFASIFIFGLIGKAALYFITDSNQIFENITDNTTIPILFFITIVYFLKHYKNSVILVLFLGVLTLISFFKDDNFKDSKSTNPCIEDFASNANLEDKEYVYAVHIKADTSNFSHTSQIVYPPLAELRYYINNYFPYEISIYDRLKSIKSLSTSESDENRFLRLLSRTSYHHFVEMNKKNGNRIETKIEFLKEHNVDILIFEKGSFTESEIDAISIKKEFPSCNNTRIVLLKNAINI